MTESINCNKSTEANCNTLVAQRIKQHAIASISPVHDCAQINQWNSLFSPVFAQQDKSRRYVNAFDMFEMGIFEQVFNPQVQALIYQLIPDAVLYHCHAYETDARQNQPHILADNFCDGWHRDWDCQYDLSNPNPQQFSLFVYLTDVHQDSGCFEVNNKKFGFVPRLFKGSEFYQARGKTGYTFIFDRVAYHRASPNLSDTPRRVLKISFQSQKLTNKKLAIAQFSKLREVVSDESVFLRQLIGDQNITAQMTARYMREVNQADKVELADNPPSIKVKISLLHEFRAYIRDLKYVFNLLRR